MAQSDLFALQDIVVETVVILACMQLFRNLISRLDAPPGTWRLLEGALALNLLMVLAALRPVSFNGARICGLAVLAAAFALTPILSIACFTRGRLAQRRGDRKRALGHFKGALTYLPEFALAHHLRGRLFQQQGLYEKAAVEYDRAVELWLKRGPAVPAQSKTRESAYTLPKAYSHRALNNFQRNRRDEAARDWERALELDPDLTSVRLSAGSARYMMGDYNRAAEHASLELERNPESVEAYSMRAAALSRLGRDEEAIEDCNRALQLHADFEPALLNRSVSYLRFGDPDKAIEDCREALRLNPNSAALGILGLANSVKGNREGRMQWACHLANTYRFGKDLRPSYPVAYLMPLDRLLRITQPSAN